MAEHRGRVFKTTGDGLLAEFSSSAVQALRCALAIQDSLRADASALQLRIGLHSGDVVVDGDDVLGDGVNIAARIEPLAEPGGICISARVREDAVGKIPLDVEDLGEPELKNITQKVRIFRVRLGPPERPAMPLPDKPSLVVLPFQNMSGDPEQEYFVDGLVEDITTALSRAGGLFVIARNSAFTYKGKSPSICARWAASLACATCWKAACADRAGVCVSRRSSSKPPPGATPGRSGSKVRSRTSSRPAGPGDIEQVVGALEPSLTKRRNCARATAQADRPA